MTYLFSSALAYLLKRGVAVLAALLVTGPLCAQPATIPVISLNGPLYLEWGTLFTYQIATVPGTSPATSFAKVGGDPAFTVDAATGLVTAFFKTASVFPYQAALSFTATNAAGTSPAATIVVTVVPTPPITFRDTATVGVPYVLGLDYATSNLTYTSVGLPPGLLLNPASAEIYRASTTAVVFGTPTKAGTYNYSVLGKTSAGNIVGEADLVLIVKDPAPAVPVIYRGGPISHTVGPVFSYQIEALPGTLPATSYAKAGGDDSFSINPSTGLVTAMLTRPGPTTLSFTATNSVGTSSTTTITVDVVPQPFNSTSNAAVGVPYAFQLSGASSATSYSVSGLAPGLSLNSATGLVSGTPTTAGFYFAAVVSTTSEGPAASGTFTLIVASAPTSTPVLTSSASISGTVGVPFVYPITATGSPTSYRLRGGPSFLTFDDATGVITGIPTNAGTFTFGVTVENAAGKSTSPVTLTVAPSVLSFIGSYISNFSARANVGLGEKNLLIGYLLGGKGTEKDGSWRYILKRGLGPALADFGVPGTLIDPKLEGYGYYLTSSNILRNDNWSGTDASPNPSAAALATYMATFGAFPLKLRSRDAVIPGLHNTPSGHLLNLTGVGNSTGIALAEIHDGTRASSFLPSTARLSHLSARAQVGIGDDILIAGFNLIGNAPRRLLIRAVGPTLGAFGIQGVLTDPQLSIFAGTSRTALASNDNWDANTAPQSAQVGAFALPAGSKDAVVNVNLAPGTYTIQVSGVGGTIGVALLEIYELP